VVKIAQLTVTGSVEILGDENECLGCLDPACQGCGWYHNGRFTSDTLERLNLAVETSPSGTCRICGGWVPLCDSRAQERPTPA
jgi:hypothetical protein